jgi:hypothetical protein
VKTSEPDIAATAEETQTRLQPPTPKPAENTPTEPTKTTEKCQYVGKNLQYWLLDKTKTPIKLFELPYHTCAIDGCFCGGTDHFANKEVFELCPTRMTAKARGW